MQFGRKATFEGEGLHYGRENLLLDSGISFPFQ